ncbi:SsgA family sporulation/cell division regulator [Streptomyces sp. NPDC094468]|uniref:SsgA family sporulation/cell division regulator n=1 Tax=Streptomyces sp. NPDC094468 TaxID=3366066 RepID=UPI00382B49FB
MRLIVTDQLSLPVPTDLRYEATDPYAVRVVFHVTDEQTVQWLFARQLLIDGMHQLSGTGDVGIWPSRSDGRDVICISLSSDTGEALLEAPARALASFLRRTQAAVPPGTESQHIDVNDAIVHLLADS